MHPWLKGIQVCSNEWPYDSQKVDNGFFSLSYFKLLSYVSDMGHGPLILI